MIWWARPAMPHDDVAVWWARQRAEVAIITSRLDLSGPEIDALCRRLPWRMR
jgi:hypothetical protein